jgi:pimeloyl-CoA synthetase
VPIVITAINSILNQNVGKELGLVDIDNKLKIEMEKIVESIKTLKTFTIDFSEISDPARKKEIEALADKIESAQVRY